MRTILLVMLRRGRWGRPLHNLNRVVVLTSTVGTALVALLLQHLLSLGISKAQQQLHAAILHGGIMELFEYPLGNLTGFEAAVKAQSLNIKLRAWRFSYRAKPTSLLMPVFSSRLIFSDTTR